MTTLAAAVTLSLSACDRPRDTTSRDNSAPPRTAQAPDKDKSTTYRDPSIPPNPPANQPKDPSVLPPEQK
jgi:hypothetical protein